MNQFKAQVPLVVPRPLIHLPIAGGANSGNTSRRARTKA